MSPAMPIFDASPEWPAGLERAEQAAAEACGFLRAGTVEGFTESAASIGRCLEAVQSLLNSYDPALAGLAAKRLAGETTLRRRIRQLVRLHDQAARFYRGRLETLAGLGGHYGPQGGVLPVPPPSLRLEA